MIKLRLFLTLLVVSLFSIPTVAQTDFTFDVTTYVNIYPDIKNVYGNNTTAATTHYYNWGLPSGRRGSIVFDPVFYLQRYSDLATAFGSNYQAAAQHFIYQGLPVEGRQGSAEFDVQYYLANNPDIAAAYGSTNYSGATQHFVGTGLPLEGRRGSAQVDIRTYINNYPDVAKAFPLVGQIAYYGPMLQWLKRGKGFLRNASTPLSTWSTECSSSSSPNGYPRVFPAPGTNTLDAALRPYSGDPAAGIPATDHLIVCLDAGLYLTDGSYNWVINIAHSDQKIKDRGFALGPHWHIHGKGSAVTTVQLNSYYLPPPGGEPGMPQTGSNVAFATGSDTNPGVEISDITIDCNYPGLKALAGTLPLRLEAIHLRDDIGGHYVHHVNVINAAGEDPLGEAFPVWILSTHFNRDGSTSANPLFPPSQDNTIEFVTMSQWHGHTCTAITMAFATGTIQYNVVNGYQNAYGGWEMPLVTGSPNKFVYIHDNWALNGEYGFNIDSEYNNSVNIQFNEILVPSKYGIVVGNSGNPNTTFNNFVFLYNEIQLGSPGIAGLVFSGGVGNAVVARTNFLSGVPGLGIQTFGNSSLNISNFSNVFQYNQIDSSYGLSFSQTLFSCNYGNWNQNGVQRSDFPNNTTTPCRAGL
jgi:hypothetical protein